MTIRRDWQRGETVPIFAEVRLSSTGALFDPDSVRITLVSPITRTKILDNVSMTRRGTGDYVYYWNSSANSELGWYKTSVRAQDGSGSLAKITIEHSGFQLQE